jgi:hypothetical protein
MSASGNMKMRWYPAEQAWRHPHHFARTECPGHKSAHAAMSQIQFRFMQGNPSAIVIAPSLLRTANVPSQGGADDVSQVEGWPPVPRHENPEIHHCAHLEPGPRLPPPPPTTKAPAVHGKVFRASTHQRGPTTSNETPMKNFSASHRAVSRERGAWG